MRIIEYKKKGNSQFEKYVDIGSIERNIDILPLFDETKHTYQEWHKEIINEPLGVIITIINYYKLELDNECFSKVTDKIKSNIKIYTEFNNKWFEEDTSLFKGLDLNFEDIEEEIEKEIEINDDKIEFQFNNGDIIRLNRNDIEIKSLYIIETEYENFKKEVSNITELLR